MSGREVPLHRNQAALGRLQQLDPIAYLPGIVPALIAVEVDPLGLMPGSFAAQRRRTS